MNIHIHKGPTIWPFNRDAFDVADVDEVATLYRDAGLRFIVEHCGIPRIEDFCWIAAQEPNVYGGLAVVMLCAEAFARGHLVQFVAGLLVVAVVAVAAGLATWAALGHWRSAIAVLLILAAAALLSASIRDFFTKR